MVTIFVDTGAFCAFSDRSDYYHFFALDLFSQLLAEKYPLITTNFIVGETYTWLRYNLGHNQALRYLKRLRESEEKSFIEIITITKPIEAKVYQIIEKFPDQKLSYTDATSFVLIQERRIRKVFTFDRHFYLINVEVIPGITK